MAKHTHTAATDPANTDDRVITTAELLRRLPLNRSTLWRMSREGRFIRPIQLTSARIGWKWSSVLAWLREREQNPIKAREYYDVGALKRAAVVLDERSAAPAGRVKKRARRKELTPASPHPKARQRKVAKADSPEADAR